MRAIWKGSISFGLVNIPVGLYSASRPSSDLKLKMLRKSDLSPIRYRRVAEADGKEVPWDQIAKGYEHEKGSFVLITDEDFKRARAQNSQTVDIQEFVDADQIDPMYFDQPYFLAPEKRGEKAYALLREALKKAGKVGIAKVVLKSREHLAAVKPSGHALVLELMHFQEALADPEDLSLPEGSSGKKETDMALSLIESMAAKWDPAKYHDESREILMQIVEEKIKADGKGPSRKKTKSAPATNVVDLVEVLQQSIQSATKSKRTAKRPSQSAPRKKTRKAA